MRGIVRAVLVVAVVVGLAVVVMQVSSILSAGGEAGVTGIGEAFRVAMTDDHLKAGTIGGVVAFAVGLLGLLLMACAWRPKAKAAAKPEAEAAAAPEAKAEGEPKGEGTPQQ